MDKIKANILELCSESEYGSWEFWSSRNKTEAEGRSIQQALAELVEEKMIYPTEKQFVANRTYTPVTLDEARLSKEISRSIKNDIDPDSFYWFLATKEGKAEDKRIRQNEIDQKNLIDNASNRLQFAITIGIFFSGLAYSFEKAYGQNESQANKMLLSLAIVVIVYILNYVLFEVYKRSLSGRMLRVIGGLLLFGVVLYLAPVFFLGMFLNTPFTPIKQLLFQMMIYGIPLLPIVIFLLIHIDIGWWEIKGLRELYKLVKDKFKNRKKTEQKTTA